MSDEIVTAAEANRSFSRLLQGVRAGHQYVVTSHGTPVARIVPVKGDAAGNAGARNVLLRRLSQEPAVEVEPWTRDELYDDDE